MPCSSEIFAVEAAVVPAPTRLASSTATSRPCSASSSAVASPTSPAPMTTVSKREPAVSRKRAGTSALVNHNDVMSRS
ncbi:hypothetical protein ACFVAV_09655 [Nocardia sp. NPDC057663]|uniref:hypothetical protein n=1 Tax=Nocardia sp. NPDC057663 TaxID=3346201 RepID=UPI00366FD69B